MIDLFPHNKEAYEVLVSTLENSDRACIIHPTGTGKSFIGAKLIEDNPEDRFIWLTPSDYIWEQQVLNFERVDPGFSAANVVPMTYAMAMYKAKEDGDCPSAVWIVLDEFHRAGAQEWSKGVAWIRKANPHAKIVGMTATEIRHSDGARDMAAELFGEENVASRMKLPEAWARGILVPPVYVAALYDAGDMLLDYEERIERIKNDEKKNEADKLYEKLRRTIDASDGLDVVFPRYLDKPDAKLIVFCRNVADVDRIAALASEWFSGINEDQHVYRVYVDNPRGDADLEAFRADDSSALKLLFCVNQLNEGVHISDVDGIVMVRPTKSPTIYLQQLGRSFDTASGRQPLVFDVVNNFASLQYELLAQEYEEEKAKQAGGGGVGTGEDSEGSPDFVVHDETLEVHKLSELLEDALYSRMTLDEKVDALIELERSKPWMEED